MANLNYKTFKDRYPDEPPAGLNHNYIKPGDSILDIGGASGSLLDFINKDIPISGAVLDTDADCLGYGKRKYPNIKYHHGEFPSFLPDEKYDIVSMQALFPHLLDWKASILGMSKIAKKYINFSALVRVNGTTIADPDISYFYYLDTGRRTPQVLNNIFEIINFLSIEEVRAKKIQFWGGGTVRFPEIPQDMIESMEKHKNTTRDYTLSYGEGGHAFRCDYGFRIYQGNFMVELFSEEDNPKRMGGLGSHYEKDFPEYSFFRPEVLIDINDRQFFYQRNGETTINATIVWGGVL